MPDDLDRYARHLRACRNAVLPGRRLAFRLGDQRGGGQQVGWLAPELREAVLGLGARQEAGAIMLDDTAGLPAMGMALAARGLVAWRGEEFDVRGMVDGAVLGVIDRGSLPAFGIEAQGVHVNGLVRRPDGLFLWVGRRGANRPLDAGKLDHLVAGGIGAGYDAATTLVKEAAEEAAIPAEMARAARPVGTLVYAMERPEGLRRDRVHMYDLELPADFAPHPEDGEAAGFELWPIARVMAAVRDTDEFKFNVSLVLIDLFLRQGLIDSPKLAEELRRGA